MEEQLYPGSTATLVAGLAYADVRTAKYLKDRSTVSYFTTGNSFGPNGVRVLRFEMVSQGDDFLDPGSVRVAFTLHNNDPDNPFKLLSMDPLTIFTRLRVLVKGQLIEDINYLHRTTEMFSILLPPQRRKSLALQMMGDDSINVGDMNIDHEEIPPGSSRRVLVPLPSGF